METETSRPAGGNNRVENSKDERDSRLAGNYPIREIVGEIYFKTERRKPRVENNKEDDKCSNLP